MVYLTMLSKDHVQIFSSLIYLFVYLFMYGLFNDAIKISYANPQFTYLFIYGLFNDSVKRS
jgi:hypothetical protein